MNYKETLFFVTKCLTINLEKQNKQEIEMILRKVNIEWDLLVKLSTKHYVLPALYCNLKQAGFLKYLPIDLVDYMKYITDINRNRNKEIIKQSNELNSLLKYNNLNPIFLKGAGNLLGGLYFDIAERMVGDIDIFFLNEEYNRAIEILKINGYNKFDRNTYYFPEDRHYPKMIKNNKISSVEIHKEVMINDNREEFNAVFISKNLLKNKNFSFLSYENQLSLSIISSQINDYDFIHKRFSLRNAYDVYLLSKKVNAKKAISKFKKLKNPLNCFLAMCNVSFGDLECLNFDKTKDSDKYISNVEESLQNNGFKYSLNFRALIITLKRRFIIILKSIFNRKNRNWLLKRIKIKIIELTSKNP